MGVGRRQSNGSQAPPGLTQDLGVRKMTAGGAWRRPRMKVYDYNQEFGGNYYQLMIQYINHKDIYGPFSKKADVYLPHSAEVTSAKYTNMRYNDKSSAKHN